MPPLRTMPAAKAVKTERTHEENQERAYIAASRRSDRSLEARLESARRASEIHKKRTGRALRVTEQDVINEEMYEEEDDDLPMQYRRLTAHLQTSSAEFNRRLSAYLTGQVAARTALDQAIASAYGPQYGNAAHFAQYPQYPLSFPSPMAPPQAYPHMVHPSPEHYRQSPYPLPMTQALRHPGQHQRSSSIATPTALPNYHPTFPVASPVEAPENAQLRQASLPPQPPAASGSSSLPQTPQPLASAAHQPTQPTTPAQPSASRSSSVVDIKKEETQDAPSAQAPPQPSSTGATPHLQDSSIRPQHYQHQAEHPYPPYGFQNPVLNFSPFSMALPTESQILLGPALDPSDPFTSALMSGSDVTQMPFYGYNSGAAPKLPYGTHPSFDALNGTLAPSALDATSTASAPNAAANFVPKFGFGLDPFFAEPLKAPALTRANSAQGSGTFTPGVERDVWSNFIDGNLWEEGAA